MGFREQEFDAQRAFHEGVIAASEREIAFLWRRCMKIMRNQARCRHASAKKRAGRIYQLRCLGVAIGSAMEEIRRSRKMLDELETEMFRRIHAL